MWGLGAELVPAYDPEKVTHIITMIGTGISSNRTCNMCGVKSLADIPEKIKTFGWDWIIHCHTKERVRLFLHCTLT